MPAPRNRTFRGGCFCGAITVAYSSRVAPADTPLRSCTCSFCLKHGSRNTSDVDGHVRFEVRKAAHLSPFDFRHASGGRLTCAQCGVYVGIACRIRGRWLASVNTNTFDRTLEFTRPPQYLDYSAETPEQTRERRETKWTPAAVVFHKQ